MTNRTLKQPRSEDMRRVTEAEIAALAGSLRIEISIDISDFANRLKSMQMRFAFLNELRYRKLVLK